MKCDLRRPRYCAALLHHAQSEATAGDKGLVFITMRHKVFTTVAIGRCVAYRRGGEMKQTPLEWCPFCGARLGLFMLRSAHTQVARLEREDAVPVASSSAPEVQADAAPAPQEGTPL